MSSRSRPFRSAIRAAIAVLFVGLPFGSLALADAVDPAVPKLVVVGAPRGPSPSDRVDSARTGRAKDRLPSVPAEVWNHHLAGGLELPPIVTADGSIVAALSLPEVAKLSKDGKELWRTKLSPQEGSSALRDLVAASAPVALSDGTVVVVTANGYAIGISPSGVTRFATPLAIRPREGDTTPLAQRHGGVVVAAGRSVIDLDGDGHVRARATLDERATGALLAGPDGTIVTGESGAVYSFKPPLSPRKLGTLGGVPRRGAALADARTLVAVVDNRRVVSFDLATGATHVRASVPTGTPLFDGPVAIHPAGVALAATQGGLLLGVDGAGNERVRMFLEKPPLMPDAGIPPPGGFVTPVELKPSPPLLVDGDGRVAFARAGGRVGLVAPDGRMTIVTERACSVPLAVLPAGEKRMLVACRDGAIFLFGE